MQLDFFKYDGAGNDFVIFDFRSKHIELTEKQIAHLCHRRFGIGADGVMTLSQASAPYDFTMRYYNSDGREGSMCGNGGRCIAALAYNLGLAHKGADNGLHTLDFVGYDGPHHAEVLVWNDTEQTGIIRLGMKDVDYADVRPCLDGWFLDTGSPHYVQRVKELQHFDVVREGRRLRNLAEYFPHGTNVDFIEELPDGRLMVRTYERGVEDETWACGTGVTACAIVSGNKSLVTRGGDFKVDFDDDGSCFKNIKLTGPVSLNFCGTIVL